MEAVTPREEVEFPTLYGECLHAKTPIFMEVYDSHMSEQQAQGGKGLQPPPPPRLPFHPAQSGHSWIGRLEEARDALPRGAIKPARSKPIIVSAKGSNGEGGYFSLEIPKKRGRGRPRKYGNTGAEERSVLGAAGEGDGQLWQQREVVEIGVVRPLHHYIRQWSVPEVSCQYDLDSQDLEWLKLFNEGRAGERGARPEEAFVLMPARFERVMEGLELGWEVLTLPQRRLQQRLESGTYPEEMPCEICGESDTSNCNVIVLCDDCDLAVHQECYGVSHIPEGPWLCRVCSEKARWRMSVSPQCIMCPWPRGALRKTSDHRWAHVLCAHFIPETGRTFSLSAPEAVIEVIGLDPARARLRCVLCRLDHTHGGGYPTQCSSKLCSVAFHPICARQAGWPVSFAKREIFCNKHANSTDATGSDTEGATVDGQLLKPDLAANGSPQLGASLGRPRSPSVASSQGQNGAKYPLVEICDCPPLHHARGVGEKRRMETIAPRVLIDHVMQNSGKGVERGVVEAVARYWSLKREARRGTPLLRSLLIEPEWPTGEFSEEAAARSLCERRQLVDELTRVKEVLVLLRQREQAKLEAYQCAHDMVRLLSTPYYRFLRMTLCELQEAVDPESFFAEPVPVDQFPDYPLIIAHGMDFATILRNVAWDEEHVGAGAEELYYPSLAHVFADLWLIAQNARTYNVEGSVYYEAAEALEQEARQQLGRLEAFLERMHIDAPNRVLRLGVLAAVVDGGVGVGEGAFGEDWPVGVVPDASPVRFPHRCPASVKPAMMAVKPAGHSSHASWSRSTESTVPGGSLRGSSSGSSSESVGVRRRRGRPPKRRPVIVFE